MSVRNIFFLIFTGFAGLLGCLVYVAYLAGQNQKMVEASETRRFLSYQLADELRQSSDDLTRFARTYVVTGDPVFEQYFRDVLAIRNGSKRRPENYGGIYWDFVVATGTKPAAEGPPVALQALMREMDFTDEELRKLAESEANSNALVRIEEKAMNAVKKHLSEDERKDGTQGQAELAMARQIMFGKEYHKAKAAIMRPLSEFLSMVDERTAVEADSLHRRGRSYGLTILSLAGVGLFFTIGAFLTLHRRVLSPVRQLAAAAERVEAGRYDQPVEYSSKDELGNLASSFNQMTNAIEQDIHEREKNEAVLAKAKKAADVANQAKSDFLSNMSHELRTPLNGVLGYVQILQRDRTLGPTQKKSLDSIGNCGEHLLNLINDVLDLSKIEAGKLEISLQATDLSKLLDGVRDIVKPRAEGKGLDFVVKVSPEVPRGIMTDPIKLRQMLVNLLGNSVKFTSEGTIALRVMEAVKGELRFDVEDTGMGIAPEKLGAIFEPFKQAEGGVTEGGTGLGLSISRRIAEALGGTLTATSEPGDGSTFTLSLPFEETEDLKGDDFTIATMGSRVHFRLSEGGSRTVLIADDRETNREILDQILTDAGFETVLTTDGDEALEELRKREFDIFLCDVRMPRMNGIEVIKEVRADKKLRHNKVFAVTASVFPEFQQKALDAGFDDFLMKPLRVGELAQKLSKLFKIEFQEGAEGEASPNEEPKKDPVEAFKALPPEVLREFEAASKVRNLTKLGEIASRLQENEDTSAAGQHLGSLLAAFDFAGLKTLENGLNVTAESEDL